PRRQISADHEWHHSLRNPSRNAFLRIRESISLPSTILALPIFSSKTHFTWPATDFLSPFIAANNRLGSRSSARGKDPQALTALRNNSNSSAPTMPRFFEISPATRIP